MQLRIKIGASADRTLVTGWEPAVAGAQKAADKIAGIAARQARTYSTETKRGVDAADREYSKLAKQADRWQRQMVRDAERAISDKVRAEERANAASIRLADRTARERARVAARAAASEARDATREHTSQVRAQARTERDNARTNAAITRGAARWGGQTISAVAGAGRVVGRAAFGAVRDLAGGLGVDLSAQSIFQKNQALETSAINLSNQGYIAGDKRNGRRIDSGDLVKDAFTVSKNTGTDANDAMAGLEKFTSKTGDLATGREILSDMAILSKATGAGLEDMVNAAGDAANALGDVENKGAKISQIMRIMAGQGKLGAVEIKDLANQMAKLGAAANTFGGGEEAIAQMGVLAQMSRAHGGASSATGAATSVSAFANTFSKGARLHKFEKFGVQVLDADNKPRTAKDVIIDSIRAASSDKFGGMKNFNLNMGQMVADAQARRATKGFEQVFIQAGGGEAGIKAVEASFEQLRLAAIADTEVMESFKRAMESSQSQAAVFNTQVREIAMQAQGQLMPALIQLAPAALGAAKQLADMATWVAKLMGVKPPDPDDKTRNKVNTALTSTDAQLAGGKISEAQIKENQELEAETRKAFEAAQADLAKKKADQYGAGSKAGLNVMDALMYGRGFNQEGFGRGMGDEGLGGAMVKTNQQDVTGAQLKVEQMEKALADLTDVNKAIRDKLNSGLEITKMPQQSSAPTPDSGATTNVLE